MSVAIELRKPGKDGRVRLLHPRTDQERWRLIQLAHESHCELGLSYRQTRRRLEEYGALTSLGTVANHIKTYECDICAGQPAQTAQEQPTEPTRVHQAQASGLLTGQVTDA